MDQILHRGGALTAATVLVGAGLLAPASPITVPTPPAQHVQHVEVQLADDVLSALTANVGNFFTDTWGALTSLGGLHLGQALGDLVGSWQNLLYMPDNLIMAGLALLTGESPHFFVDAANVITPNVLGQLWTEFTLGILPGLQVLVDSLFSFKLAAAFDFAAGLFDYAVIYNPAEIIGGTLMSLGL